MVDVCQRFLCSETFYCVCSWTCQWTEHCWPSFALLPSWWCLRGAFFESLANACHAQPPTGEFPGRSHRWLAKGPGWLWAVESWPSWRKRNITDVCVQPPALHRRCFRKEQESKLYSTSLCLATCSFAKRATTLFSCQVVNPSVPSGGECWAPVASSWLICPWPLSGKGWSHCPFHTSLQKSHNTFHWSLFLELEAQMLCYKKPLWF